MQRPSRPVAVIGIALVPFLLAACAGAPTPTAVPQPAKIDLSGYLFTPNILDLRVGAVARFELIGDGLEHSFTIQALGVDISVPQGTRVQTVEFRVPETASGTFPLVCRLHELAGMTGAVRVERRRRRPGRGEATSP